METYDNWQRLNARMKEEDAAATVPLFQIHMGAFDDLRKNGHRIQADGKPVSVLAPTLSAQDRFQLACSIGRSLIDAQAGIVNGGFAETCAVRQADFFPHCIAIALGAILEGLHPGQPVQKTAVLVEYETFKGNGDPLGQLLPGLEPCFPWAVFRVEAKETDPPAPAPAAFLPLDKMKTLFRADGLQKIDTGRASFSGTLLRGSVRKGDVLNVTDARGQRLCPPGVVLDILLKDRVEEGRPVVEKAGVLTAGMQADSLFVAVEVPRGSYQGILLCAEGGAETEEAKAPPPAPKPPEAAGPEPKKSFLSRLFGKK